MTDPAEIAAKLTKAQRKAILALKETWLPTGIRHHLGLSHPRQELFDMWAKDWALKLTEHRGYTTGFRQDRLTPLGLAVRAELEKRHD